jgi:hypothetical protein
MGQPPGTVEEREMGNDLTKMKIFLDHLNTATQLMLEIVDACYTDSAGYNSCRLTPHQIDVKLGIMIRSLGDARSVLNQRQCGIPNSLPYSPDNRNHCNPQLRESPCGIVKEQDTQGPAGRSFPMRDWV